MFQSCNCISFTNVFWRPSISIKMIWELILWFVKLTNIFFIQAYYTLHNLYEKLLCFCELYWYKLHTYFSKIQYVIKWFIFCPQKNNQPKTKLFMEVLGLMLWMPSRISQYTACLPIYLIYSIDSTLPKWMYEEL